MKTTVCFLVLVSLIALNVTDNAGQRDQDKKELSKLQAYIGSWRGVGQPRRGSNRGAWIEQTEWAWSFPDAAATLVFKSEDAKYLSQGTLRSSEQPGQYELLATSRDGQHETIYRGGLQEDGRLILNAETTSDELPARISLRLVAEGKRLVILYERRTSGERFSRLAEVGYTREGSDFGKGTSFVECVVTGGKGTIPVSHNGKSYYVCCSGCKELFEDDPEQVLREYAERKASEKQ